MTILANASLWPTLLAGMGPFHPTLNSHLPSRNLLFLEKQGWQGWWRLGPSRKAKSQGRFCVQSNLLGIQYRHDRQPAVMQTKNDLHQYP
jgi:hypothetical protein